MKVSKIQSPRPAKLLKTRKDSDKESPSTAAPNSPENCCESDFKSQEGLWILNCDSGQTDNIRTKIDAIEEQHEEMKNKFDKIVGFLIAQINKNNEDNRRLAKEVRSLKNEVKEFGEDILTISTMIGSTQSRLSTRDRVRKEGLSRDKMHVRDLSKSKSKGLLISTRSYQRMPLSKRISTKGSKYELKYKI